MFSKTLSSGLVALQNRCLTDYELPAPAYTFGGILQNSKHVWLTNGPNFLVCNTKTGRKVAGWTFGLNSKDNTTRIVCVDEIVKVNNTVSLLAIGLESSLTGGVICIFDMVGSKLLQVIQLRDKISSLHVFNCNTSMLPHFLSCFNGVISVGTNGGDVYLIDFYQSANENDEANPAHVKVLSRDQIHNIEYFKHDALINGFFIAIHVNELIHTSTHHFALKGPKGEDRLHVNREEVAVSALYYCAQLASLLVGFNFGALQLWNISDLKLLYTSRINEDHMPVSYFAIQEPSDDPRAFFYFWAVCSNTEPYQAGFPVASFYSLVYNSKDWQDGLGYIYNDLQSCSLRFEMDLVVVGLKSKIVTAKGAQCIQLRSIKKGVLDRNVSASDSLVQEESMALLYVVWNVWATDQQIYTFMNIFDLNQWYKEQMPNSITYSNSFLADFCISDMFVDGAEEKLPLLDVQINEKTIEQFLSIQRLEEHYCPSSLSFDFLILSENELQFVQYKGLQKALLYEIESVGPLSLIRVSEVYERCLNLGLVPLYVEIPSGNPSLVFQRELILSTALEQHLIGWLCKCASAWGNGSHTSAGCTNDLLLNWAWKRAAVLKTNADKLCVPLFDHSELRPDNNILNLINSIVRQLSNLAALYDFILSKLSNFLADPEIIVGEFEQLRISAIYFEVLQWLLNVGLLPERAMISPKKTIDNQSIMYPANILVKYYNEKRAELQRLNKDYFSSKDSLLFIDNLIEVECQGVTLHEQWEKDGGNGSYPPVSLQALLRTYLIECVDEYHKHCVVYYLFQDLISLLNQEKYCNLINYLKKFPIVFNVSPSLIKIVEAFWQFDRGDFEVAVKQLLDPLVNPQDLKTWHHKLVLRALLAQNQHKLALLYFQVQHPPVTTFEDVCIVLAMYVTNNMIDEALIFLRRNQSIADEEEIFAHFYKVCDETGKIRSLVRHAITKQEETFLLKYLRDINHPLMEEFKVVYFLQRSRYTDLLKLNEEVKWRKPEHMGLVGQSKTNMRERISKMLSSIVPKVTANLGYNQLEGLQSNNEVHQPAPLSVFVQDTFETSSYKSKFYQSNWIKSRKSNISASISEIPSRKRMSSPDEEKLSSQSMQFPNESYFSPIKKRKINSQQSLRIANETVNTVEGSTMKFETPVVKRVSESTRILTNDEFIIHTPPSILKSRKSAIVSPNSISELEEENINVVPSLTDSAFTSHFTENSLRVTPRRSLLRTSVRFEDTPNTAKKSIEKKTVAILPATVEKEIADLSKTTEVSSKETTESSSSYYSLNVSMEISDESKNMNLEAEITKDIELIPKDTSLWEKSSYEKSLDGVKNAFEEEEEEEEGIKLLEEPCLSPAKPKSRRSYKDSPSVRSSPRRLSKLQNTDVSSREESFEVEKEIGEAVSTAMLSSPRGRRISSRKSLTRQVLINNTISKELIKSDHQSFTRSTKTEAESSILEIQSSDDSVSFSSDLVCSPMPEVDRILLKLKQRNESVLRSFSKKESEIVAENKKITETKTVDENVVEIVVEESPEEMVVDEVEKERNEVIIVDSDTTLEESILTTPEVEVVACELNIPMKDNEKQSESKAATKSFNTAFITQNIIEESLSPKIDENSLNIIKENGVNTDNRKDSLEKSDVETKPNEIIIISRSRLRHSSAEPDIQSNKRNLRSSSKTKTEEPQLAKRTTRSASADELTPARRSRRKSSTEQTLTTPTKRTLRPRKSSTDTTDSLATEKSTPKKTPRKRLTSNPTEDETFLETSITKPTRRKRATSAASAISLPVIPENRTNTEDLNRSRTTRRAASTHDSPITSSLEDYSATRRLTRRQKSLLEKTVNMSKISEKEKSDSDVSDDEDRGPNLGQIDPIILLSKVDFKGKKDPEEQNVLKASPEAATNKKTKSKSVSTDGSNVDDEDLSVSRRGSNRKKRLPKIAE